MHRRRVRLIGATAAALVFGSLATTVGPNATAALTCPATSWSSVATRARGHLNAVAALSVTDVWAAGSSIVSGHTQPLVEHWDGGAWAASPAANPGADSVLRGIAMVSPTDGWAVGSLP